MRNQELFSLSRYRTPEHHFQVPLDWENPETSTIGVAGMRSDTTENASKQPAGTPGRMWWMG